MTFTEQQLKAISKSVEEINRAKTNLPELAKATPTMDFTREQATYYLLGSLHTQAGYEIPFQDDPARVPEAMQILLNFEKAAEIIKDESGS